MNDARRLFFGDHPLRARFALDHERVVGTAGRARVDVDGFVVVDGG